MSQKLYYYFQKGNTQLLCFKKPGIIARLVARLRGWKLVEKK